MIEIPQEMKLVLRDVGLNAAEQQVIFYLFKHGVSNIADIAANVKLPRSTIHLAVEELLKRNVLATTVLGKRRMVYIEKPEKIKKFVEHEQVQANQKMKELESLLPDLRSFFALRGGSEK